MDNKNKIATFVLLMAMVVTLGSAVVARKIARGNEEISYGDMIDNEHRITDVTVEGNKLVYKDNSVKYTKYVILQYAGSTTKYTEDTYYWFNNLEEYQENFRNLADIRIDYNPETLMIRTMSGIKDKPWDEIMNELKAKGNIKIIR